MVSVGPGEEIDADAPVELALGLGDKGIAGADQHVDGGDRIGAQPHRAHRLHAPEDVDLVRPAHVHRRDDRRIRPPLKGRGRRRDARHAGDRGGDDRHMRRGDHRELAGRHVAADRLNGDRAVPEDDARKGLDLDVRDRRALNLGEAADLRLGEADVGEVGLGDISNQARDLVGSQAEARTVVVIEALRVVADSGVATRLDVGEDALDGRPNADVLLAAARRGKAALKVFDCHDLRPGPGRRGSR